MWFALWLIALLVPPAFLVVSGVATVRALLATALGTWASATFATQMCFGRGRDPIMMLIWYFVLVLPCATAVPAGIVASRTVRPRARLIPTIGLAMVGFVIGMSLMLALGHVGAADLDDVITSAVFVGLPTSYAACGALYAVHLSARRT